MREDRIKIEYIKGCMGMAASILDKVRENRLRWFGHVLKREKSKAIGTIMEMNVKRKKKRGRPKKR